MGYFDGLVGQDALKRKLGFYLDAFKVTSKMPFLLFCGAKGFGKTRFMREVAANLHNVDGTKRRLLELNCSVIKNNQMFFENIFLQFIQGQNITIAWDECHNLPTDLAQALLTICNTEKEPIREFHWDNNTFYFDFRKISFLWATTEPHRIFGPLKDRFDVVDFEPYTHNDMRDIVKLNTEDVMEFEAGVLDVVVSHLRGNARSCVKMAESLITYCSKMGKVKFGFEDWRRLCHDLSIKPFGMTASEIMVLRELKSRGACSLTMLASATGLSRSALQMEVEQYLLARDFVRIDIKRKLTDKGQKALALCG